MIRQDIGLSMTDKDFHSPLICSVKLRPLRNQRERTKEASMRRKQKYDDFKERVNQNWYDQWGDQQDQDPTASGSGYNPRQQQRPQDSRSRSTTPRPRTSLRSSSRYRFREQVYPRAINCFKIMVKLVSGV